MMRDRKQLPYSPIFRIRFRSCKLPPMRRATTILLGILLGALAAGIGIGLVLKKANDDRERLAKQIEETVQEAAAAREENRRAIEEANRKLQASNLEIGKAQQIIKALEEERNVLAQSTPLAPPAPKAIRGWNDVVGLDQGVSFKQPPDSKIESNDTQALTLVRTGGATELDPRWFSLTPYNPRLEEELRMALTSSTAVAYVVNGRILTGVRGTLPNRTDTIMILRVRYGGQITHLMWVRDTSTSKDSSSLMNVLASLRFAT